MHKQGQHTIMIYNTIHVTYIDIIPESNLEIVRPMLSFLAKNQTTYEPFIIETNLSAEEKAIIKAGRKELKEHPENFISLKDYLAGKPS